MPKTEQFQFAMKKPTVRTKQKETARIQGKCVPYRKNEKKNEMSRKPIFYLENEYAMQLQLIENGDSGEKK